MSNLLKLLSTSPEAVVVLIFLVVPGFIFIKLLDALVPGRRQSFGKEIIDIGGWSFAILAVWFVPALLLFELKDRVPLLLYHLLVGALVVLGAFVTPILAAYILYTLEGRGHLKNFGAQPNLTPWDWFFSNRAGNYYVLFHRKEGQDLGGYFGDNSFAASSSNAQQIYVEELWRVDEDGKFIERVEGSEGAVVNSEDCEFIEFFETLELGRFGGQIFARRQGHLPLYSSRSPPG
ncbi:MAG: hypothetical protein JO266_13405 [Acidobacteria bacterium]|nr:hypothetical protein [Acidobacteriota bacterium]